MTTAKTLPTTTVPTTDQLKALVDRAQKGDRPALGELRGLLRDPAAVDAFGGDLAWQARASLIEKFTGKNLLFREALTRKVETLRAELCGPNPTALETLLADRIVSCWLHLHHLEIVYAQKGSLSLELGGYYQRALTAAQKRYLSAVKALASVRKLALPALQINIAKRQVNVAGSADS